MSDSRTSPTAKAKSGLVSSPIRKVFFKVALPVFGVLLGLSIAEVSSYLLRKSLGKSTFPLFWAPPLALSACEKMIFDPHLGYIHKNDGQCKIRDGYAVGNFVYYLDPKRRSDSNIRIVTLGGSTTSGFFQHISNGFTWPLYLFRLCNLKFSSSLGCDVINGGTGGYTSSKEYMQFVRDVVRFRPKPDLVISLNGINDVLGYGSTQEDHLIHPFLDRTQLEMLNTKQFPLMDRSISFLPNVFYTLQWLRYKGSNVVSGKKGMLSDLDYYNSIPRTDYRNAADVWKDNVEMMHGFSKSLGMRYLVFLQPTLGLKGQPLPPAGSSDAALLAKIDSDYSQSLNLAYDGMRKECAKLPFCYDFSEVLPPTGDSYNDPRHFNERGNKHLSEKIYSVIDPMTSEIQGTHQALGFRRSRR